MVGVYRSRQDPEHVGRGRRPVGGHPIRHRAPLGNACGRESPSPMAGDPAEAIQVLRLSQYRSVTQRGPPEMTHSTDKPGEPVRRPRHRAEPASRTDMLHRCTRASRAARLGHPVGPPRPRATGSPPPRRAGRSPTNAECAHGLLVGAAPRRAARAAPDPDIAPQALRPPCASGKPGTRSRKRARHRRRRCGLSPWSGVRIPKQGSTRQQHRRSRRNVCGCCCSDRGLDHGSC